MRSLVLAMVALIGSCSTADASCSPACDLNGDGLRATVQDYAVFLAAFGARKGEPKYSAIADLDGNGAVTAVDFGTLSKWCPLGGGER